MADVARENVLGRVRRALRTARLPAADPATTLEFSLEREPPSKWIERFVAELAELRVTVHRETSEDSVRARVRALIRGKRVLAWEADALPYRLGGILADAELATIASDRATKAAAEVGLTGVDAAIAETGTLALLSSARHPRSASLLPPVHVAVVRASDVLPTLGEFLRRFAARIPTISAINLVTGPSRTADIELRLTLGVHGPGELIVVLGP